MSSVTWTHRKGKALLQRVRGVLRLSDLFFSDLVIFLKFIKVLSDLGLVRPNFLGPIFPQLCQSAGIWEGCASKKKASEDIKGYFKCSEEKTGL